MNNKAFAIKKITLSSTAVSIIWEDNKKSLFHFLWLRDNCPTSFHPDTRMRIFNILSVSKDIHPMQIKKEKNRLIIHWSENNHISKYDLKWLRNHCYTNKNSQSTVSKNIFWKNNLKSKLSLISFKYEKIIKYEKNFIKWLELLASYGVTIIKPSPTTTNSGFKILKKLGTYRETFFGTPFEVVNITKPNNQAYTSDALSNHTDLPYYEYVPGYQFLHCLENSAKGGNSTIVDGFSVANYLKKNEKEIFDILTNTEVKFKDNDYTQKSLRIFYSPIIKLNLQKNFDEIRINLGAMATLDIKSNKMKRFYEAYHFFYSLLRNKKYLIEFRLTKGDMLCFDNRRVLHGRTSYNPHSGNRHLQGYYIEREEVNSKLNYLKKILI